MNADGLPGIRRAPQPLPVEVEYVLAPARVLRRPPWGEGVPIRRIHRPERDG